MRLAKKIVLIDWKSVIVEDAYVGALNHDPKYHDQKVFEIWNPDQRVFKIWDPEIIDELNKIFIEHYGTPKFIYKVMETDNGDSGLIRVLNNDYLW